jgi:hypothetical protein
MELKNVEIISINKLKKFEGSEFYCVEWVVKDDSGQYPQFLKLQCNKEKADNLIKFNKVGERVDVSINLQGRQWTNPKGEVVTFNTIEAWKVFKADENIKSVEAAAKVIDGVFEPAGDLKEDDDSGLPF